jgi:deoxyribodipyrimidine photolyase-related protein
VTPPDTVWVLGDQLNTGIASLEHAEPGGTRILMVESQAKLASKRFHRQRLHLVVTAMRRFAEELRRKGFEVDYRRADSFAAGLASHRREHAPERVLLMEPMSWSLLRATKSLDVELVRSNQFLCHYDEFAEWAQGRNRLVMEDFYRFQRRRLGYLMDGDEPAGGKWNYDAANREPPPAGGIDRPQRPSTRRDDLDDEVLAALPDTAFGGEPDGTWATSRRAALARLRFFVDELLPGFGPYQDAILVNDWAMGHSLLSPYLNLGMLTPDEVCDAAEEAYREGRAPIESVEGFIRQIIGWREYVWGLYWLEMPDYARRNTLHADRPLPPLFTSGETDMHCVADALASVHHQAYAHHIQRLMVFGNLALLAGIVPQGLVEWMWASFVDGAEWVMVPNVIGMALYADGGLMATKPYAAGGNYLNKMSDACGDCRFDPKKRAGDDACPFTTLYWDFLDRNQDALAGNHRLARQLAAARKLSNLDEVRRRADEVLGLLDAGEL